MMRLYTHLFYMGLIGFFSSIPTYFLFSTMILFLKEKGVGEQIGILSLMTLPYSFKILISALVSQCRFVPLIKKVGYYRFWALTTQICICFLFWKGPGITHSLLWAFFLALIGATLDCVLESYRIESTDAAEQSIASGYNAFGWRIGAWGVNYVPLVIAGYCGWKSAFHFLFVLSLLGVVCMAFLKSAPSPIKNETQQSDFAYSFLRGFSFFKKRTHFLSVTAMIGSYKIGDIFLRQMIVCYLRDVGCSLNIIAQMDKGVGMISTLAGVSLCSFWIHKKGLSKGFYLWLLAQSSTALLFLCHSVSYFIFCHRPPVSTLWFIDSLSHFSGGIGSATLLAYYAFLCKESGKDIMICYAILSSIGSFGRTLSGMLSGNVKSLVSSWPFFFCVSIASFVPALVMLGRRSPFIFKEGEAIDRL